MDHFVLSHQQLMCPWGAGSSQCCFVGGLHAAGLIPPRAKEDPILGCSMVSPERKHEPGSAQCIIMSLPSPHSHSHQRPPSDSWLRRPTDPFHSTVLLENTLQ